jgi:hypothetical protein
VGIFGCIVYLVACYISVGNYPESQYMDIWMVLMTITSISSFLGDLGVMGSIFGTRCCNCIKSNRTRVKARFFILAVILQLTTEFEVFHYLIMDVHLQLTYLVWFIRYDLIILAELRSWSASMLLIGGTRQGCCIFKWN